MFEAVYAKSKNYNPAKQGQGAALTSSEVKYLEWVEKVTS